MAKRKAAVVQTEVERALRAAIAVTGRPHAVELLPGGGIRLVPMDAVPPPLSSLASASGDHGLGTGLESQEDKNDVAEPPRILL